MLQSVKDACGEALAGCLAAFPDKDLAVSSWADSEPTRRMLDGIDALVWQTALQNPEMLSYWAHRKQQSGSPTRSASRHDEGSRRLAGGGGGSGRAGGSSGSGGAGSGSGSGSYSGQTIQDGSKAVGGGGGRRMPDCLAAPEAAVSVVPAAAAESAAESPLRRSGSLQHRLHSSQRLLEIARRSESMHRRKAATGVQPSTAARHGQHQPSEMPLRGRQESGSQRQPHSAARGQLSYAPSPAASDTSSAHSFASAASGGWADEPQQMEAYIAQVQWCSEALVPHC